MYKIKTEGDNFKQHIIEKSYEETATFSIEEIEAHERKLAETKREATATRDYEAAKIVNIISFHAFVAEMSALDISTVSLYKKSLDAVEEYNTLIGKVVAREEMYTKEKAAIYEALGFTDGESA